LSEFFIIFCLLFTHIQTQAQFQPKNFGFLSWIF
jgi:hypothetical protein